MSGDEPTEPGMQLPEDIEQSIQSGEIPVEMSVVKNITMPLLLSMPPPLAETRPTL